MEPKLTFVLRAVKADRDSSSWLRCFRANSIPPVIQFAEDNGHGAGNCSHTESDAEAAGTSQENARHSEPKRNPHFSHEFAARGDSLASFLTRFGPQRSAYRKNAVSKLRKRAGKIRDMDVLTAHAASVELAHDENYCSVALLEYLGAQRLKHAAQPGGGFLIRPRTAELPLPRSRSSGWARRPW